jgi:putative ABC transport system substrate-binding protein
MKSRRRLLAQFIAAMAAMPLTALGQGSAKPWRVAYFSGGMRPADGAVPAPLRQGLTELGYVEGRNVQYDGRWTQGDASRLPAVAAELAAARPDVVVVIGYPATLAIQRATSTIPIVTVQPGDAVATGLVRSLAHPGGNLTGLSDMSVELAAKRVEVLKDTVPKARRLAILWNQDDRGMTLRYQQIENAARALGVSVQAHGVRQTADIDSAFAAMSREPPDMLFLVADMFTVSNRKRIIDYAATHRIPAMYEDNRFVQDGGLISYGPRPDDIFHRASYYVDRVLKGTKPGELPMEQPTRTYLYINLKTAKELGLPISQTMLFRADKVIE